ncbi:tRNA uridine-5-carboxymethylaminomethyl(34) synthesis enzyme MnmG [Niameybacter massiliensis]|uniref:tRNA uridine 5-carboxymethylaminomethyl modification enzyme MnmG n=1 Tax=Holtiella tumoricola TaxID=3018743 RepID=A0AA42DLM2_9FIRM|nr:tRNA uridine-5-carboxymethylaminomethyl(34) synthesis enzyme MnmG [Holtiella tumoricola]MDA3730933.1 tRNA uridine-5-carboxymethylaminomethyl(34) synthesis enzyme MnmG [Holtiella tumoricola]
MTYIADTIDIAVIGGGHAGCEAALAAARMGKKTIMFTMSLDSVAMMPCNPNVGGTSKGHLVREIDALGGEMGKNIDKTYIQSRMLNTAKGPAVHSLRAQADKKKYTEEMKKVLENTQNLAIKQQEIVEVLVEDNKVIGVITNRGAIYNCKAVVLASGTYLKSRCLTGENIEYTGPNGLKTSTVLSEQLKELGIEIRRFKTGTPARVDARTIDFSKMEPQHGDQNIVPFSFENTEEKIKRDQHPCYLTYTNERTHQIIRDNLHRSPLYSGVIEGTGPRYCPSIEDKVVRFADKDRHQVFLEPEGEDTTEMYVQGMSSSLPEEVQLEMLRSLPGMEKVEVMRTGYAIEYDCVNPLQLKHSLEFKHIDGFFSGGQMNGSSGYEEAACQGLIAGINAALKVEGREPLIIDRSEGYIGVLIDDLVTKGTKEPYRMMTSRAEYRLLLRQDNADLRLTEKGYKAGLVPEERYNIFVAKRQAIDEELERLKNTYVGTSEKVQAIIAAKESTPLRSGIALSELLKRPELSYNDFKEVDETRPELPAEVIEQAMIELKYEGYISRQLKQVEQFKKLEKRLLPEDINYDEVYSLRLEAVQKLKEVRPVSIGQASRISGVSPADISVLLVYLEQQKNRN